MAEAAKQIHLVLRSPDGSAKRALRCRVVLDDLRRCFLREYRGERLSYSAFKKIVFLQMLHLKFDSRLFASVLRACDPHNSGHITLQAFLAYAQEEFVQAMKLGLRIEADASGFIQQPKDSQKPNLFSQREPPIYTHAGFSQSRLRTSYQRALKRDKTRPQPSRQQRPQTAIIPKRGLLRHEITQLRGSGVLCTDGQLYLKAKSVAQESWLHPSAHQPSATTHKRDRGY